MLVRLKESRRLEHGIHFVRVRKTLVVTLVHRVIIESYADEILFQIGQLPVAHNAHQAVAHEVIIAKTDHGAEYQLFGVLPVDLFFLGLLSQLYLIDNAYVS